MFFLSSWYPKISSFTIFFFFIRELPKPFCHGRFSDYKPFSFSCFWECLDFPFTFRRYFHQKLGSELTILLLKLKNMQHALALTLSADKLSSLNGIFHRGLFLFLSCCFQVFFFFVFNFCDGYGMSCCGFIGIFSLWVCSASLIWRFMCCFVFFHFLWQVGSFQASFFKNFSAWPHFSFSSRTSVT